MLWSKELVKKHQGEIDEIVRDMHSFLAPYFARKERERRKAFEDALKAQNREIERRGGPSTRVKRELASGTNYFYYKGEKQRSKYSSNDYSLFRNMVLPKPYRSEPINAEEREYFSSLERAIQKIAYDSGLLRNANILVGSSDCADAITLTNSDRSYSVGIPLAVPDDTAVGLLEKYEDLRSEDLEFLNLFKEGLIAFVNEETPIISDAKKVYHIPRLGSVQRKRLIETSIEDATFKEVYRSVASAILSEDYDRLQLLYIRDALLPLLSLTGGFKLRQKRDMPMRREIKEYEKQEAAIQLITAYRYSRGIEELSDSDIEHYDELWAKMSSELLYGQVSVGLTNLHTKVEYLLAAIVKKLSSQRLL